MEHRWGQRIPVRVPVRLIAASGESVLGQTENISISGAFVLTERSVPLWARLEIEIIASGPLGRRPEAARRRRPETSRAVRPTLELQNGSLAKSAVRREMAATPE